MKLCDLETAKALKGFHQATDCWASGRFYSQEFVIEDAQGYKVHTGYEPGIIINPIGI